MAQGGFFQKVQDHFSSGDPEVATWFLVRHTRLPFVLCFCYVLFVTVIGPAIMRNRKPLDLRKTMVVFNFFVVSIYVTCLFIVFWYLPKIPWEQFCKESAVSRKDYTYTLIRMSWVIYLLKYVEFLDTVFFVVRKKNKQITFLHVMHHTVVPLLGWSLFRSEKSAFQSIPVILNSVVHIVMYSYYGLAAMGPAVKKYLWWKKYLTLLQIVQFVLILFFVSVVAPLSGCSMNRVSYTIDLFFGPLFLFLFYRFYRNNFVARKAKAAGPENGVHSREAESRHNGKTE